MEKFRQPFCKDYAGGVTFRIFLLLGLWFFYGMVPHRLPLESLWLLTATLIIYAAYLGHRKDHFMMGLIILAAALNTLLIPYLSPGFNLLLTLLITVILFFDIVNAPQKF